MASAFITALTSAVKPSFSDGTLKENVCWLFLMSTICACLVLARCRSHRRASDQPMSDAKIARAYGASRNSVRVPMEQCMADHRSTQL